MKGDLKFNTPKDKEDKRRLLIDLETQIGVIIKVNDKIIVSPFSSNLKKQKSMNNLGKMYFFNYVECSRFVIISLLLRVCFALLLGKKILTTSDEDKQLNIYFKGDERS